VFRSSRINLNLSNSFVPKPSLRMRLGALARGQAIDRSPRRSQIKGRTFEVPGSGGFLLTERVPHLEEYFEIGEEIAAYSTTDELIEQVRHWLSHPEERAAVAEAGYRRVRAEHTYDHRFAEIFRRMGLG
jgi:spore maturation protein CgeB